MRCRRHAAGPGICLWVLIAVADAVLLVTAIGVWTVLLTALGLALVAAALVGTWLLWTRRPVAAERAARRVESSPLDSVRLGMARDTARA